MVDAVIINTSGEFLLQERVPELRLVPESLTLPGGHVDNFSLSFESELSREVFEETGLKFSSSQFELLASRPGAFRRRQTEPHLNARYLEQVNFTWNSYIVKGVDPGVVLSAGDDCARLMWIAAKKIAAHPGISPEVKAILLLAQK